MRPTHGLLLIDKPAGMTSHDVVASLRKTLRQREVGHTGTLDPLATGLMVIVLGDATKLSDYLVAEDKGYRVRARFGVETDTLDISGRVLRTIAGPNVPRGDLEEAAKSLEGEFEWPVPVYSAMKVDGKKLCQSARAGHDVDPPSKQMVFSNVQILDSDPTGAEFRLDCTKGSFVRSWISNLGTRLGVGAAVESLCRERVGSWRIDRAVSLADPRLESERPGGSAFIPMSQALPGLRAVMANAKEMKLVGHGQIPRAIENRLVHDQRHAYAAGKPVFVKVVSGTGDLLAILAAEPGQGLRIKRVFRTIC